MLNRTNLSAVTIAGLSLAVAVPRLFAATAPHPVQLALLATAETEDEKNESHKDKGEKEDKDDEKDEKKEHGEKEEKHEKKEIEQAVPMNMVPAAVLDVVKKEIPGGTITESELVAKKGKIFYSFDVKNADMAYDVEVSVDGKFISKKVEEGDENDEKDEAKPATQKS